MYNFTPSQLSYVSTIAQFWSLPLEVAGLLLIIVELYWKNWIAIFENYVYTIMLGAKIYIRTFNEVPFKNNTYNKNDAKAEGIPATTYLDARDYAKSFKKAQESLTAILLKLISLTLLIGLFYATYQLSLLWMSESVWRIVVWLISTWFLMMFLFSEITLSILNFRYGRDGVLIVFASLILALSIFTLIGAIFWTALYLVYHLLRILKKLGNGKYLGAIGIMLAFAGVSLELLQYSI